MTEALEATTLHIFIFPLFITMERTGGQYHCLNLTSQNRSWELVESMSVHPWTELRVSVALSLKKQNAMALEMWGEAKADPAKPQLTKVNQFFYLVIRSCNSVLHPHKRILKSFDKIINVLQADREADEIACQTAIKLLLFGKLTV